MLNAEVVRAKLELNRWYGKLDLYEIFAGRITPERALTEYRRIRKKAKDGKAYGRMPIDQQIVSGTWALLRAIFRSGVNGGWAEVLGEGDDRKFRVLSRQVSRSIVGFGMQDVVAAIEQSPGISRTQLCELLRPRANRAELLRRLRTNNRGGLVGRNEDEQFESALGIKVDDHLRALELTGRVEVTLIPEVRKFRLLEVPTHMPRVGRRKPPCP